MGDSEFPDSDDEFEIISINAPVLTETSNATFQKSLKSTNGLIRTALPSPPLLENFPSHDDLLTEDDLASFQMTASSASQTGVQKGKKRTFGELQRDVSELLNSGQPSTSSLMSRQDFFDSHYLDRQDKRPRWNQSKEIIDVIRQAIMKKRWTHQGKNSNLVDMPQVIIQRETMSLKIPPWNFVGLTRSADSRRIYIRLRPKNSVEMRKPTSGVMNLNYIKLQTDAEQILLEKVRRKCPPISGLREISMMNAELWVDKYRPRSYMELLSDETVNRSFLHWMKLWDKIVFGRKPHHKYNQKKYLETNNFGSKKIGKEEVQLIDNRGFPTHKIALLSGPPGLGKTTLAHLVAKHAGYNVVEINASDERGPEAFRQALLSSTQMRTVMGVDPRPNCLVLDEIDGAPTASIDLLIKFVQGKLISKGRTAKESSAKQNEYCKRPVVCICNEAYAPALRSLRHLAYIINVPRVSSANLADRLSTIAGCERLKLDQGSLIQLAERSGCDIRSCLSALQYMGVDCGELNESLGSKDMKQNIFDIWKEILKIPMDRAGPLPFSDRVQRILQITYSESSDRLTQGVFENYPTNCSEKMDRVAHSLEWFQLYDRITTVVNMKQDWAVAPYIGYCFVNWHFGFAGTNKPKLCYPHTASDVYQRLNKSMGILSVARKSRGHDIQTIILDIAPFVFELVNPKLRSVASNLYSSKEREDLTRLINVMLDLGISFVQEKSDDGAINYQIEPNLCEVGTFPECKTRLGLSYAVKQIVVQELEIERVRRTAMAYGNSSELETQNNARSESINPVETEKLIAAADASIPISVIHLNDVERIVPPKTSKFKNFFQNFKKTVHGTNDTSLEDEKPGKKYRNLIAKYGVWYKYKEGFSNSIRRDVTLMNIS